MATNNEEEPVEPSRVRFAESTDTVVPAGRNQVSTQTSPSRDGARATDTLANERTFLAYARTALAFVGFGFVIARFALFTREVGMVARISRTSPATSTIFGTLMALAGVACAGYGAYRYITTARALRAGANTPMPDGGAVIIAVIIGVIGLVVTWTLFAFR